ncbi:hypothetical protein ACOSQ2_002719 [Xanthoceras sorbifolium]
MDFSIAFLANIDAATKERDAAICEKDVVAKEALRRELLDKIEAYKVTMEVARTKLEIRAVDRYKRSPTFDGFMHQEYMNGMRESYTFFKDDVVPELLEYLDITIILNENKGKETLARKRKLWWAYCRMMKLSLLDMYTEAPPKDGKPTYFTAGKEGTLIMGACLDEGPVCNFDYSLFVSDDDEEEEEEEEIDLTSNKEDIDEDKSIISTLMKK